MIIRTSGLLLALSMFALPQSSVSADSGAQQGYRGFLSPIPNGNGRACATCHVPRQAFTISPDEVQKQFRFDPKGPLFRSIDADDFSNDYSTMLNKALFRVTIPLPPNVKLIGSSSRAVKLFRAVPSVFNAKLTAPYTHDGRAASLHEQAHGAALEHSRVAPEQLPERSFFRNIAAFEKTVFSSEAMRVISKLVDKGAPIPPPDKDLDGPPLSQLEERGFQSFKQHCINCHGGPARDKMTDPRFPTGFISVGVSERNRSRLPVLVFDVTHPDKSVTRIASPDPGRMLITGKAEDANFFEPMPLRGIGRTAPYFHDHSSPDLEDVLRHYNLLFEITNTPKIPEEEFEALVAYLKRL